MIKNDNTNKHYKDRLFKFIFGNPEMKQNTLSLFNAINDKHFDNVEDLELNTLEDVIYMRMKNDVSFLYCSTMNLYEHQSTYNPNMPLRGLFYFSNLYERFIDENKLNIYRRSPLTLPTPTFIVLYNGTDKKCEDEVLKLSDLFAEPEKSCIDLTCRMINVNYGHNLWLLDRCKPLMDYSIFIEKIRIYRQKYGLDQAIDLAIEDCIKNDVLTKILSGFKAEVKNMCLTEYDEELDKMDTFNEGLLEGKREGLLEGKIETLLEMTKLYNLPIDEIIKDVPISKEEFLRRMKEI